MEAPQQSLNPVAALFLVRCDVGKRQGVTNVTARARDAPYDEGTLLMPISVGGMSNGCQRRDQD